MMSKKTWVMWSLIVAGSTLAVLNLGGCLADFLLQQYVLSVVN